MPSTALTETGTESDGSADFFSALRTATIFGLVPLLSLKRLKPPPKHHTGRRRAGALRVVGTAATRGVGTAASAGVLPPAAHQAAAADQAPLALLQLPAEVLVIVFGRLDARSPARLAATFSELFRKPMTPAEEVLRQCAAERGRVCPSSLPLDFSSWAAHLAWFEAGAMRRGRPWRLLRRAPSLWRRAVGS